MTDLKLLNSIVFCYKTFQFKINAGLFKFPFIKESWKKVTVEAGGSSTVSNIDNKSAYYNDFWLF